MPNMYGGDQFDPGYAPYLYDKKGRLRVGKARKRLREAEGLQKLVKKAENDQVVKTLCKAGLEREFFEFDSNSGDRVAILFGQYRLGLFSGDVLIQPKGSSSEYLVGCFGKNIFQVILQDDPQQRRLAEAFQIKLEEHRVKYRIPNTYPN